MMKLEGATIWDPHAPEETLAVPDGLRCWIVHTADSLLLNKVLACGVSSNWRLLLAHSYWSESNVDELARKNGAVAILRGTVTHPIWQWISTVDPCDNDLTDIGGLGVFTSGTTGEPKLALHTWESIRRPAFFAARRLPACRWLMTYNVTSYAGLQVFFAALATGGSIVYAPGGFAMAARAIVADGIEAISATPTWWRMLLAAIPADVRVPRLVQASLGGERVDQSVLDAVSARFRPRRLTHIYASTEAGSSIVVSDGKEGFPSVWLDKDERVVRLRIVQGQLEIASPYRMLGYAGSPKTSPVGHWYRTPDLVEQRGERVYFVGRADTIENIGGAKVVLEEVEQEIMKLGWFSDCRVYGRSSPITGTILCAELVMAHGHVKDLAAIKKELSSRLPRHSQPQHVQIVAAIQISTNGKKLRK